MLEFDYHMKYLFYLLLLLFSFNIIGLTNSVASTSQEQTCKDFLKLLNATTAKITDLNYSMEEEAVEMKNEVVKEQLAILQEYYQKLGVGELEVTWQEVWGTKFFEGSSDKANIQKEKVIGICGPYYNETELNQMDFVLPTYFELEE